MPDQLSLNRPVVTDIPSDSQLASALRRDEQASARRLRVTAPAWLTSLVLHGVLLTALALIIHVGPQHFDGTKWLSFVLRSADSNGADLDESQADVLLGNDSAGDGQADGDGRGGAGSGPVNLLDVGAPSDPVALLPALPRATGYGAAGGAGPSASELTRGGGGSRSASRGRARTGVFGVTSEGYKFVYVFDRSGSMGGSGRTALAAAKAELLKSLDDLAEIHQFEIVFYNDEPSVADVTGAGHLVFGTAANKAVAKEFIERTRADGSTNHEAALLLALRLRPDVIFFLTDADEPTLNRTQLERIRRLNAGVSIINTIEFGLGPSLDDDNFLKKLARENSGQHVYFDISQLRNRG